MSLTEAEFTAIVEKGCPTCGPGDLALRAFVQARFTLLEGEAYGAPRFGYKGEELARGTFRVECATCKQRLHESDTCPGCAKPTLAKALETPDAHAGERPRACPGCQDEQVGYVAWVPVALRVRDTRPDKPRTLTSLDDEGCHGVRVECKECLYSEPLPQRGCALCGE
jgi:hypothetical protein